MAPGKAPRIEGTSTVGQEERDVHARHSQLQNLRRVAEENRKRSREFCSSRDTIAIATMNRVLKEWL